MFVLGQQDESCMANSVLCEADIGEACKKLNCNCWRLDFKFKVTYLGRTVLQFCKLVQRELPAMGKCDQSFYLDVSHVQTYKYQR